MRREINIQDELKDAIERIAREFKFDGIRIAKVERDYPIQSEEVKRAREVDLVLFEEGLVPFMFIETKRKGEGEVGFFSSPLDALPVGQVSSYAAIYKRGKSEVVPFIATANPEKIAVFETPKDIDEYVNWEAVKHRRYENVLDPRRYRLFLEKYIVWYKKLELNDEYIYHLLSQLAQKYLRKKEIRVEPAEALRDRLREFVYWVAGRLAPSLQLKIRGEPEFRLQLERLGYKIDPENLPQIANNVARMISYVFMNKIVFYKLLERIYHLPHLRSFNDESLAKFKEDISYYFRVAVEKSKDFEPIFITGLYDLLPLPDDRHLIEYINGLVITLDRVDLSEMGEQIGYIYEELIPPEERHQLGQFYTPPWVCDFIARWCIKDKDEQILDPGVGSGGFLLKAYEELARWKVGERRTGSLPKDIHEKILEQLYAVDINPFPAHLTAMALAMKNVRAPSTKMNILPADFFSLQPLQQVLAPYTVKTVVGEVQRKFAIPKMDVVMGNPPYTRWTEIPDETQELIKDHLSGLMKKYKLTPQVSIGIEPGIYTYWIMHATDFLKEGGRLGMIISNTWLQTDYGIGFANFLLDHYRIRAILDFALKLFKEALITTCIILAEKESDEKKRLENNVVFMHIPGEVESEDINTLLEAVELSSSERYAVTLVKQGELPRDKKWIDLFFKTIDISKHPLMIKLGELFEPLRGNTIWSEWALSHGKRPDPGSSEFHYMSPSKVRAFRLTEWAYPQISLDEAIIYPAITSARQTNFFTFTEGDWEKMRKSDDGCYMFVCHKPKDKLPNEVIDYIRWGETGCRTRIRGTRKGGRLASETEAAKVRAKEPKRFHGWYDLGGVIPAPIFTVYQAWYKTRFTWCNFPVAMYHALIALIPKEGISLSDTQAKALLAYLNSSFAQAYIEAEGRKSPGGIIGFEINIAKEMPTINVRKLSDAQMDLLAKLFDELETKARKIGGASTKGQITLLKPKMYEIDRALATILGLKDEDVKNVETQVDLMVERRISAATRTSPQV